MIYNLTHEDLLATAEYNESYEAFREESKYILTDQRESYDPSFTF